MPRVVPECLTLVEANSYKTLIVEEENGEMVLQMTEPGTKRIYRDNR